MDHEELAERLQPLPKPLRVAFAAACAERILIIHELCSNGGPVDKLEAALSVAWVFASGASPPLDTIARAKAGVDETYPDPELGGGPEHFACGAVDYALDALKDETGESAALAATRALETISNMGDEDGVAEEEEWQEEALTIVERWRTGTPIEPALFATISERDPEWRTRWET